MYRKLNIMFLILNIISSLQSLTSWFPSIVILVQLLLKKKAGFNSSCKLVGWNVFDGISPRDSCRLYHYDTLYFISFEKEYFFEKKWITIKTKCHDTGIFFSCQQLQLLRHRRFSWPKVGQPQMTHSHFRLLPPKPGSPRDYPGTSWLPLYLLFFRRSRKQLLRCGDPVFFPTPAFSPYFS